MDGEAITVIKQPKRMGFLDVEDAVSAILAVYGVSASSWQTVYNVGNGNGYTVEEIYNAVASELKNRIVDRSPLIEFGTDTSSSAVSCERLNGDTGFVPAVDLKESVKRIIAHI